MQYTSMSQIISSPIEDVTKELEKLSYGELVSFKKMIELQYQEIVYTKQELDKLGNEESKKVVKDLYKVLQKVEDIATVVEELKKQRSVK